MKPRAPQEHPEDWSSTTLMVPWFAATSSGDLVFRDEEDESGEGEQTSYANWRVLVVDDDESVHEATALTLRGVRIGARGLELLHAYSAADARNQLSAQDNIDIMLLDVVMETKTAGLALVRELQADPNRTRPRIVIRTGQPGLHDEHAVRHHFRIDGYIAKGQQTRAMMVGILESLLLDKSDDTPAN